jgi:hypothetical protein
MHSYASGSTPAFPIWGWIIILWVLGLIVFAGIKYHSMKSEKPTEPIEPIKKENIVN